MGSRYRGVLGNLGLHTPLEPPSLKKPIMNDDCRAPPGNASQSIFFLRASACASRPRLAARGGEHAEGPGANHEHPHNFLEP